MPIMLVEGRFGIASMRRGYNLVQDSWPTAFVVWFVSVPLLLEPANIVRLPPSVWQFLLSAIASIGGAYSMVVTVVYYFDRRYCAEKADPRELVAQMDDPEVERSSNWL